MATVDIWLQTLCPPRDHNHDLDRIRPWTVGLGIRGCAGLQSLTRDSDQAILSRIRDRPNADFQFWCNLMQILCRGPKLYAELPNAKCHGSFYADFMLFTGKSRSQSWWIPRPAAMVFYFAMNSDSIFCSVSESWFIISWHEFIITMNSYHYEFIVLWIDSEFIVLWIDSCIMINSQCDMISEVIHFK